MTGKSSTKGEYFDYIICDLSDPKSIESAVE